MPEKSTQKKPTQEKETSPQKKTSNFTKEGMWAPWGPVDADDSEMFDARNAAIASSPNSRVSTTNSRFFWPMARISRTCPGRFRGNISRCTPGNQSCYRRLSTTTSTIFHPLVAGLLPRCWEVPRQYFEMHPRESVVLPKVIDNDLDDIPPFGRRLAAEVLDISNDRDHAAPGGDHANVLKYNQWQAAVQGYLASITFADAQVGRVLDALAESPHADNTIVVLWGDHGYHLGQKEHWRKHTLWEDGLRTTLVISAPGIARRNVRSDRVVSLLDIYPTLIELAGLDPREGMDGQSIVPLLKQADLPWSRPAVSTYGFQNHSIRTERWRYIRYHDGTEELYDHDADPNEWTNLAAEPVTDEYRAVMNQLALYFPEVNVSPPGGLFDH